MLSELQREITRGRRESAHPSTAHSQSARSRRSKPGGQARTPSRKALSASHSLRPTHLGLAPAE